MNNRILKVNSEIQKALSEIITYELRNPLITGIISVTKVDTTTDLEISKVYISILDENSRVEVFNQIKHSASHIRQELAKKIILRKVPYLDFQLDESYEYGQKIENMLKQINSDKKEGNE